MELVRNDRGFTLINALFRLFLVTLSLPIFIFAFAKLKVLPTEDSLMMYQFFHVLQNEMYMAEEVYQIGNRLYFKLNDYETAMIEKYESFLRRRINNKGHEIYLRDVEDFELETIPYGIKLTIELEKGGVYERTLISN